MVVADPRRSAASLLEQMRDGRWWTRSELRAAVGQGWPLLLRALEHEGHRLAFDRSRFRDEWWRVRLVVVAAAPEAAPVDEQLALGVAGSAPPRSAVLGLEDAAA